MNEREKIQALVHYRMEQAAEALASADALFEGGFYRGTVNRAYYAMF